MSSSSSSTSSASLSQFEIASPIDWSDCASYEYVNLDPSLEDETRCTMSQNIIVNPVTLKCCNNSLCSKCANKVSKCPFCRSRGSAMVREPAPHMLRNLLDNLPIPNTSALLHQPPSFNSTLNSNINQVPPPLPQHQRREILTITVDIGNNSSTDGENNTANITIREGDDSGQVAREFAERHGIENE